jgi:hypothetical protein
MSDELTRQAEALGIRVDGRWSDARIQEEINRVATPQTVTTPVKLLYAHWFAADERTEAGTVVNLDIATAKKIIASGKGERADPLPGEAA